MNEKDYEEAVKQLKKEHPQIGRRVYKTAKKSWEKVFHEMLNVIEAEKRFAEPKTESKTESITNR